MGQTSDRGPVAIHSEPRKERGTKERAGQLVGGGRKAAARRKEHCGVWRDERLGRKHAERCRAQRRMRRRGTVQGSTDEHF